MLGENNHHSNKRPGRYLEYAMIALAIALAALIVIFVLNYRTIRHAAVTSARQSWLTAFLHNHGPLGAADISYVHSWMTFDYVNRLFALPPDYLKTKLAITDARYPQLTVSSYASHSHLNLATIMSNLDDAIRAYFAASSTAI